ncbi:MAG: MFS transporter [Microbacteriaceae bacterium]
MTARGTTAQDTGRPALMIVALLLVALNLRLAITSASALLTALTDSGALTPVTVVIIPALPTAVFAVAGIATAGLAERLGRERTVLFGMIALTLGLTIRGIASPWIIVLGTVVATGGLAVVNILLPAVVRAHFGTRIGAVTTAYTTVMPLGAAFAAAAAVPFAERIGSPSLGLALWALPALVGVIAWALLMPRTAPEPRLPLESGQKRKLPTGTWLLAAYFALQSLLSYVMMGWLPTITSDAGIAPERSGVLLGIAMAVGVPTTVVVVSLASGIKRMRVGFILIALSTVSAMLGLLIAPQAMPELWAALIGVGMSAFPLLLALIAGFGADATESARVSSVVQSVGYSVATLGPLGAGAVSQLLGSWDAVLVGLAVLAVVQGTIGILVTRVLAKNRREARRSA